MLSPLGANLLHVAWTEPDGMTMPFHSESKTVEGKSAGLETFPGTPLVLNFFASWRDPGREEMPLINELAAKAGGNYPVLGIAVEDTRAAVTDYAKEARLPST